LVIFVFQAEDGIRDRKVTGVQTCALPISAGRLLYSRSMPIRPPQITASTIRTVMESRSTSLTKSRHDSISFPSLSDFFYGKDAEIGRASCRDRVERSVVVIYILNDEDKHN